MGEDDLGSMVQVPGHKGRVLAPGLKLGQGLDPISCQNQDATATGICSQTQVSCLVTHHPALGQVDAQLACRIVDHARLGLPTGAINRKVRQGLSLAHARGHLARVWRSLRLGVMRAIAHHVQLGALVSQQLSQALGESRGIARFHAQTLSENRDMLGVFLSSGYPVTTTSESGTVTVRFPLDPAGRPA